MMARCSDGGFRLWEPVVSWGLHVGKRLPTERRQIPERGIGAPLDRMATRASGAKRFDPCEFSRIRELGERHRRRARPSGDLR
jgi:hypothetical protein